MFSTTFCNVKLNIPWFGDECKHARKKYKTSKRRSKLLRTTTSINETKCWEKDDNILMNKSSRKHKEKMHHRTMVYLI
jgi:hypothetical protein